MAKGKLYTFYMSLYGSMCSKWHHCQLHGYRLGLVVDKELEIWTSLSPSFAKEG